MHDSDSSGAIAALFSGVFGLFIVLFVLAVFAFVVWMQWRIVSRTGMNGALALLVIVPFGALVLQLILAFGRWPIEDQLAALQAGHPAPGYTPNPYAGPPATQ